jgi:hypothetical protein
MFPYTKFHENYFQVITAQEKRLPVGSKEPLAECYDVRTLLNNSSPLERMEIDMCLKSNDKFILLHLII